MGYVDRSCRDGSRFYDRSVQWSFGVRASARFIGSMAMVCVFAVLAIDFLPTRRSNDL